MKKKEQIVVELQKMGLSPQQTDEGVRFTYQGNQYVYCDFEIDNYVCFVTDFPVGGCAFVDVLKAANSVNTQLRLGKLIVQQEHVIALYESWTSSDCKTEYEILNAISILSSARDLYQSKINNI